MDIDESEMRSLVEHAWGAGSRPRLVHRVRVIYAVGVTGKRLTAGAPPLELADVRFWWRRGPTPDLEIGSLTVRLGERLFVQGPSGSGKSTLLSLLTGIATPQEGTVMVLGQRLHAMTSAARDRFRADHIGYIFQLFNLLPYLSVIDNVTLPLRFSKKRYRNAGGHDCASEAIRLLDHLGMGSPDVLHRSVTELSVGQQQRVAAARAIIGTPEIVFADEPTSSLDADNRETFIELLFRECEREKTTLVFVSHDKSLAGLFDRKVELPAAPMRDVGRETRDAVGQTDDPASRPPSRNPHPAHGAKGVAP
jgi:putative ABC transport system ATP-binding protein